MEAVSINLLPYILDMIDASSEKEERLENIEKFVQSELKQARVKVDNLQNAMSEAIELGSKLGLITVRGKICRLKGTPRKERNKESREEASGSHSRYDEAEDTSSESSVATSVATSVVSSEEAVDFTDSDLERIISICRVRGGSRRGRRGGRSRGHGRKRRSRTRSRSRRRRR